MAYFFVHQIVRKFGHVKIFYAGLLGNCARFIYVFFVRIIFIQIRIIVQVVTVFITSCNIKVLIKSYTNDR